MSITNKEYWDEINKICSEIIDNREDGEDTVDMIHSTMDGHKFVVFYGYHKHIMEHTNNEDSFIDRFGVIEHVDSYLKCMAEFAYWAMYDDIYDKLIEDGVL